MLMVLNKTWGGFSLPKEFCTMYGFRKYGNIDRTDSRLIDFVQSHGGMYKGDGVILKVVEIPAEATDWEMDDYDGVESIIYVVDGKLYHT